jgi:polyhydroxyalkanoate synthesis regulator phasin
MTSSARDLPNDPEWMTVKSNNVKNTGDSAAFIQEPCQRIDRRANDIYDLEARAWNIDKEIESLHTDYKANKKKHLRSFCGGIEKLEKQSAELKEEMKLEEAIWDVLWYMPSVSPLHDK